MAYDVFDRRHEIIVAGSGLTGLAAAITAARAGRKVLLVPPAQPGWEITRLVAPRSNIAAGRRDSPNGRFCRRPPRAAIAELLFDRLPRRPASRCFCMPAGAVARRERRRAAPGSHQERREEPRGRLGHDATDTRPGAPHRCRWNGQRDATGRSTIALNLAEGDVADAALADAGQATNITAAQPMAGRGIRRTNCRRCRRSPPNWSPRMCAQAARDGA